MGKCFISTVLDKEGRENIDINFFYDPMIGNYIIPKCEMTLGFFNDIMTIINNEDFDNDGKGYCLFSYTYDDIDENDNDIKVEAWVIAKTVD